MTDATTRFWSTGSISARQIRHVSLSIVLAVSGCTVVPEPLTGEFHQQRAASLIQRAIENQEPVTAPIDLYSAMARAIKYNLDYRVEILEHALRVRELDVSHYELLPEIVGSLDYNGRSNDSGGVSQSLLTGEESLQPSTSNERESLTSNLTLSWDVLDFGLSWVRAKQQANEVLRAEENKRKVIQRIIEDVRSAYWRAASAQHLLDRARELEYRTDEALTQAERQQHSQLTAPLPALSYQRELLDIRQDLQQLTRELNVAKQQLAALMNLPPTQGYEVVVPPRNLRWQDIDLSFEQMLQLALINRPELREVDYQIRNNDREYTVALLETLPSLRVFAGANWSNDDFLYNSDWVSWGAQASWNLLNVFSVAARHDQVDAQGELLEARSKALAMAVATQVSVSRARYEIRQQELETAKRFLAVQSSIEEQIEAGYQADNVSKQTLLREQMNTLLAEARLDSAQAYLQGAYANVFSATGLDAVDTSMSSNDSVAELAQKLRQLWGSRGDALALTSDIYGGGI